MNNPGYPSALLIEPGAPSIKLRREWRSDTLWPMLQWLNSNSGALQTLSALVSAILAMVTFVVLVITWNAINKQAEAAMALTQVAEEQSRLLAAQMEISRKQIHADRVAEIFKALRTFEHFVVHSGQVGPGKDFSEFGNISLEGRKDLRCLFRFTGSLLSLQVGF